MARLAAGRSDRPRDGAAHRDGDPWGTSPVWLLREAAVTGISWPLIAMIGGGVIIFFGLGYALLRMFGRASVRAGAGEATVNRTEAELRQELENAQRVQDALDAGREYDRDHPDDAQLREPSGDSRT